MYKKQSLERNLLYLASLHEQGIVVARKRSRSEWSGSGTTESPFFCAAKNAPKVAYGNYSRGIMLGCIYDMKHKPPQHSTDNQRSFAKFNGCDSDKLVIHLMECEWRYNHRNDDLYKELAKILKRY